MISICLLIVQLQAKRSEEARESRREINLKAEKREEVEGVKEVEEALELVARREKWKIRLRISQKLEDKYYQA